MSRQELYAWSSFGMTISILIFYALIAFGWPEGVPDYSSKAVKIFFNVFWLAFILEIILDASEKKGQVNKDERDFMIDAKGFRNAYNFLSSLIAVLIVQVLVSYVFEHVNSWFEIISKPTFMLHALFVLLLLSSLIRRGTQLYYYRRD
jgi:magnesium-transporting ATPase (P-type)